MPQLPFTPGNARAEPCCLDRVKFTWQAHTPATVRRAAQRRPYYSIRTGGDALLSRSRAEKRLLAHVRTPATEVGHCLGYILRIRVGCRRLPSLTQARNWSSIHPTLKNGRERGMTGQDGCIIELWGRVYIDVQGYLGVQDKTRGVLSLS
jgi:hypothetical protein